MKRIITTLLLLCSMLCIIPSCKKNSAPVEPEMPDVEGKLWFNLDKGTYSGYRFTGKTAEGLLYIKDEMQAKIYSSALKVSLQPGDVLIAVKYECKIVPETETSGLIMIKAEGEWQMVEYSELTDDSFKLQLPGEEEKLLSTPEKLGLEIKNIVEVPEPEEEAPEIEKVQARVKGRKYISHLCQIMNNVEQEFEFVITPSATAENVEVSSEDPIKWEVKSTSATGFTIIQNDEEGYCNEINFFVGILPDIYIVTFPSELKVYNIFKHCGNGFRVEAHHTVFKGRIRKIELLLGFQYSLSLHIVSLAAIDYERLFQPLQIVIDIFH